MLTLVCLVFIPEGRFFFFELQYLIAPSHYVFEGITTTWFVGDSRQVVVNLGSQYYDELHCRDISIDGVCTVTVEDYANAFFGGVYTIEHNGRNLWILMFGWLIGVRLLTFVALKTFTYSGK